jgi:hypothetical protein
MSITGQLSSQIGERTEEGNRTVAAKCIQNPSLLAEISKELVGKDRALIADCAEVMTKVAAVNPKLTVPYIDGLIPLLTHKTARVRWEAMHAIALMAYEIPDKITDLIPNIVELIHEDNSTIVRDYAVETICQFAKVGEKEADKVFPILKGILSIWEGKHRARALSGLFTVSSQSSKHVVEIRGIAEDYVEDQRGVVKKAAKAIIKFIDKTNLSYKLVRK